MINFPRRAAELQRLQQRTCPQEAPPGPRRRILLAVTILLAVLGLVFLFLFRREWQAYRASRQFYQTLSAQATRPSADTPAGRTVDFQALAAQNAETAAWLEMPGPAVDLPVVHHSDNAYYLHHSFDGTANNNGCLFLAAQDSADFSGLYHVIYGHNIHTGAMFGNLLLYQDAGFYAQYPTFTLYTPDAVYLCRIFSCHAAEDGDALYSSGWEAGEAYDAFLAGLAALSAYDTGVVPAPGSRVLTLSTCASPYLSNTHRFVLHAVMEPL